MYIYDNAQCIMITVFVMYSANKSRPPVSLTENQGNVISAIPLLGCADRRSSESVSHAWPAVRKLKVGLSFVASGPRSAAPCMRRSLNHRRLSVVNPRNASYARAGVVLVGFMYGTTKRRVD